MKKNLIVLQEGYKDCGAASLLSVIRYFGGDISLNRLIEMTNTTKEGTNFYNIRNAAIKFRLMTKCFKVDNVEKIKDIDVPFIVQMNNKNYMHFVVVYKVYNNKVVIMDPSKGKCVLDMFDFSNSWTGYLMVFEKQGYIPSYKNGNVVKRVIYYTLKKNVSIILFLVILSIIFIVISCVCGLYSEFIFDNVIDTNTNNLIAITIVFSVLFFIKNITNFIRNHLVIYLNQKLDMSIILSTYSKVILLPYCYYKNKTTAEVLSRINDLSYLKNFISKIIVTIFLDLFTFIVSFIIIYSINTKVLFVLLILNLLYFMIIVIFNKMIKYNNVLKQENSSIINNFIVESVNSFETIKGLNIEDNMIFKFSKIYSKSLNDLYYSEKINNIIFVLKEFITDIGILFVDFISFKFILDNSLTIGNYMTILFISSYFIYPIRNLIDIINEYHYVKSAIWRGNNLLSCDDESIYENNKLLVNGNIKICNLSYTFNNKYNVLDNINFFIRNKERVMIIGESGTGKSTIMKILYKYYKIDRDKIYINNYDINDYSLSDIRKYITYVSQNETLFTGSIRENILLDRDIGEIEFLNVCKLLHIDEIVKNNILGYDYMLEEGGFNLSGGQRQRIILARSLLKNSNVIMIDEGLNQVDIKLEREILINIFNYFYDKTFIIISHRRENMDLYDRVIEINNGTLKKMEERCR